MRTDRLKIGRQFRLECVRREFESERDDEDAAREPPNLPLEDALQLVHRYAERGSPKFEKALRWLESADVADDPLDGGEEGFAKSGL